MCPFANAMRTGDEPPDESVTGFVRKSWSCYRGEHGGLCVPSRMYATHVLRSIRPDHKGCSSCAQESAQRPQKSTVCDVVRCNHGLSPSDEPMIASWTSAAILSWHAEITPACAPWLVLSKRVSITVY